MGRVLIAAVLVGSAWGGAGDAAAAPRVTVRARTAIELEPIRRVPGGIVVSGRIEDRASGEPVPFAPVNLDVGDEFAEVVVADEDGRFQEGFPLTESGHDLEVSYGGNVYYSAERVALADFDVAKRPVTLTVRADDRISSARGAVPIAVLARSGDQPISIRVELSAGDTSEDELRPAGVAFTDAAGRATATLDRDAVGGPGRKRIEARFSGDPSFDQALASTTFLVTSTTELSFALERPIVKFEDELRARGRLTDRFGDGVAGAPVALVSGEDTLRESVTDERGDYALSVPAAELGAGQVSLQAIFESDRPWLEGTRSEPGLATISEPQPVPVGYTFAAFGVTCMALLAFVGLRTRPWTRWLARFRREDEDGDEGHREVREKPVQTGLAPARPSLVSTLRRPHDLGFSGTVRDAVTGKPIAGARVVVSSGGDERAAETGGDGRFALEALAVGAWRARVAASGYCAERFPFTVPHRGELRGARVDLLPVREKIFALYRGLAAPLLPEPGLWGIWTPRQIVDHVRAHRPARALSELTDYVEEAYFSQRVPEEEALAEAQARVEAARREARGTP